MKISFRKTLREWRGKLLKKEAADVLKVNLRTYEEWESGRHQPSRYSINEIKRRMDDARKPNAPADLPRNGGAEQPKALPIDRQRL